MYTHIMVQLIYLNGIPLYSHQLFYIFSGKTYMTDGSVVCLQLSYHFGYSIYLCNLVFCSVASFAAALVFHIPIQKVSFLHFVSISADFLPHWIEIIGLVLPFALIHIDILSHLL